jgi:hypothetical protein
MNESRVFVCTQAPIPQIAVHFTSAEQKILIYVQIHHVIGVQVNVGKYRMTFCPCQPRVRADRQTASSEMYVIPSHQSILEENTTPGRRPRSTVNVSRRSELYMMKSNDPKTIRLTRGMISRVVYCNGQIVHIYHISTPGKG